MNHSLPGIPNFPEIEKKWLDLWKKNRTIEKYLSKNNGSKKRFSFIDGPITANNPMGVHHGWGRTYKDLWQRFYNLQGYAQRFQNGFDCQGLWVEVEVEKELGLRSKKDIENLVPGDKFASIAKFVELCKERVKKYSSIQSEQSKRLGYFMDWDHSYYTMSDENNYMIWHFLKVCYEKGWIYKGAESVPWCPRCQTAISQHEMLTEDYKEIVHDSVYLELPVVDATNEFLVVWTTTPWTIPANIAVAIDAKLNYSLVEDMNGRLLWIAADAVSSVFGKDYKKIVKTVSGTKLVGLKYTAPFDTLPAVQKVVSHPKFHTVVATDDLILPITTTEGTGLVHTAVSAGVEDFKLGKKYGLPMIPVINDDASYMDNLGFLSGKNAKKHPELIIDYLKQQEQEGKACLLKVVKYKHRYPACWRCKTELVWKVADEWYIAMDTADPTDKKKRTYREQMIDVARSINWLPSFGLERELDWLNNMHDWLISKPNRYWGLALPIYECKKCKSFTIIGSKEELKDRACEGWEKFEGHTPHKPWIDEVKISCPQCHTPLSRLPDVGNVWLDAGIVPFSTLVDPQTKKLSYTSDKKYWEDWFPATFITESFPGQFKNWFYSLIAMSTALEKTPPFKTVLGYGSCLAEDGRPMHKSWGNSIEFSEGADKIGVDIMRWLYCRQDPTKNLLFGYKITDEVKRQFHLPLWNSLKYLLTYEGLEKEGIFPENFTEKSLLKSKLSLLDMWILGRLWNTVEEVKERLTDFDSEHAALAMERLVNDVSQWYIRLSRERVGSNSNNLEDKNAFYTTLGFVLTTLSVVLSPMLPFFAEELFTLLSRDENNSVHLTEWPQLPKQLQNGALVSDMDLVRSLTEISHSARKALQIKVRQPLRELKVTLSAEQEFLIPENTSSYSVLMAQELNVKSVIFTSGKTQVPHAEFDVTMTPELLEEGLVREYMRKIQDERKKLGLDVTDTIDLTIPENPRISEKSETLLKQKVLAQTIHYKGDSFVVNRE
ncbi:MAG: isoleucine--tRNA ligase [Patescibacteria group bacterium]|jgi:isoleucyl-tRNA synthetase